MIRDPKAWRTEAGLSLAHVAEACGIAGKNPSKTYSRYETGENKCPTEVIEAVRKLSSEAVGPDSWHQVRLTFLQRVAKAA